MFFGWTLLGAIVVTLVAYLLFSGFLRTFRLYRGVRVITCPENLQPAAVNVAAFDAARWYAISGEANVHLAECSRWPEKAGCDQACLSQIHESPLGCRVRSIVAAWYENKHCCFCDRPIGEIVWHDRPPALRMPDGTAREWKEIAPQDLPVVLTTADPVCWACSMVENFRHDHPDMIVDRHRAPAPPHAIPPSISVY